MFCGKIFGNYSRWDPCVNKKPNYNIVKYIRLDVIIIYKGYPSTYSNRNQKVMFDKVNVSLYMYI